MMTDLRLNSAELSTLKNFAALDAPADHWIRIPNPGQEFRQAVDILVLSGLVERRADFRAVPARRVVLRIEGVAPAAQPRELAAVVALLVLLVDLHELQCIKAARQQRRVEVLAQAAGKQGLRRGRGRVP